MDQRLGKNYKLCSKILIDALFKEGSRLKSYPLMMRFMSVENDLPAPFQCLFTVPKRNFKQAVKRNRIKRLMREAVRKNKHVIEEKITHNSKKYIIVLMYSDKKMPTAAFIEKLVKTLFEKLPAPKDND
jgi:ribonuclease P protein component